MSRPKPVQTWLIGNNGGNFVTMGLYAYSEHDDADPGKITGRGLVFCPAVSADNAMQGLYDPEQNSRIGLSQNPDPGGGKAVMSGAAAPDSLTEAQRDTARAFLGAVEEKLAVRVGEKYPDKEVSVLRKHPKDMLEPTAWDEQTSTALYAQYPVAGRTEILPGFLGVLKEAAEEAAAQLQPTKAPAAPPEKVWAAAPAAAQSQAAIAPVIPPKEQARILAELTTSLLHHLPGDEHAAARNEVFQDMRAVLKGQKDVGDHPH